jgi:putative membrane-bound dehydrogenase-like protein
MYPTKAKSCAAIMIACFVAVAASAEEIKHRTDAPKPLSPEESLLHFRLPDDLKVEIVASEPLLADPSAVAWDEQRRLFVSEIHGYNLEGHFDVQELNRTGQLDTVVRRIPASDAAKKAAEKETYGTIKMLLDTDGNGRMDRSTVWADRLPPCFGIVAARDGIIAIGRPDIIYLADRDNDGQAEIRETLFTGFEITILERSINNPRWGIDNWIYVSAGRAGGQITGPHLDGTVALGATDFRFKSDGSAIEPVTGRNHMFGQTMTDWGDRFVTPPGLYAIPIPQRYLSRNPYLPVPDANANAASGNRLFPTSQPHPWRVERSQQEEWSKYYSDRYGAAEAAPNGFFTSACGQMIYRAKHLPAHYLGNHFCCDPAQNLVHRRLLSRDGLRYEARRAPEEQQTEFLSSTDQWFRPLNLFTGPDGAIYIVDMYREIIEDYSAIPRYLQQQYGLIEGNSHGRLWRIVPKINRRREISNLATASTSQLVTELANTNAWQRLTVQRLLVQRADQASLPPLKQLIHNGQTPQSRLHALHTLSGLDALELSDVDSAINDPHFAVRLHALRLSEQWLDGDPSIFETAIKRLGDPDAKVRLQLALSLGESRRPQAIQTLAKLAARDGADPWMRAAILSSVPETADQFLTIVAQESTTQKSEESVAQLLLEPLATVIGARHQNTEISTLLKTVAGMVQNQQELQLVCLNGLLEGLDRGKPQPLDSASIKESLRQLLTSESADVRKLALRIAAATKFTDSPAMKDIFVQAVADALDDMLPLEARIAATEILASAPNATLFETAKQLLNLRYPPSLQLAAVAALASKSDANITPVLLENWESTTPAVRQAILDAIFGHVNRLPALLDAIVTESVSAQSLKGFQRIQLLEHPNEVIRKRAQKLLVNNQPSLNPELLKTYRTTLKKPRDVAHGEVLFKKTCASCHKLNSREKLVGPDLSVIHTRTDESILLDILEPSAKISAGFGSYIVVDVNGRTFSGVLASESATSVTLRFLPATSTDGNNAKMTEHILLRKDIDVIQASQQSLMPDNLDKQLSPQDVADVLAYVRSSLGPPPAMQITLFDEDSEFISALTQGAGQATQEQVDTFSGSSALRVTPPQRHSPRIPGWKYAIRENPGPGEFRYLRFAWKTSDGNGIMIELSDSGRWPAADSPLRRYYAGTNTTGWQALEVARQAPTSWTVVTRDLWKDHGDFTLTGIAPTAMGGDALFDLIELYRSLDDAQ